MTSFFGRIRDLLREFQFFNKFVKSVVLMNGVTAAHRLIITQLNNIIKISLFVFLRIVRNLDDVFQRH
jgi:hypothetical protein